MKEFELCRQSWSYAASPPPVLIGRRSASWTLVPADEDKDTTHEAQSVLNAWNSAEHRGDGADSDKEREDRTRQHQLPLAQRSKSTRWAVSVPNTPRSLRRGVLRQDDKGEVTRTRLETTSVSNIQPNYQRTSSVFREKESFLVRFLAQNKSQRRPRFGARQASTRISLKSATSTDETCANYIKPTSKSTIAALSPFIPKLLQQAILEAHAPDAKSPKTSSRPDRFAKPSMVMIRGAVMVADVSGFTRLTEQLGKQGHAGIELLTLVINNYLTKAIEIVLEHGGDVIKFAGDSLIVAFYEDPAAGVEISLETFKSVTSRCLQCAVQLSNKLGHVHMLPNGDIRQILKAAPSGRLLEAVRRRRDSRKSGLGTSFAQTKTFRSSDSSRNCNDAATSKMPAKEKNDEERSTSAQQARPHRPVRHKGASKNHRSRRLLRLLKAFHSRGSVSEMGSALGSFIRRWTRRSAPVERELSTDQQQREGSSRLSPNTPDRSDRLMYRGSTFWRDSLTSKRSSCSYNFKHVLQEGEMNLKVLVGCGDLCMFRVGGGSEGGNATSAPTPRFEYIVADQPNAAATVVRGHLFRQPLSQIAAIEQYANEGDTIVSEEVLKVVDHGFEYEVLEGAARITGQMLRSRAVHSSLHSPVLLSTLAPKIRKQCAESLRMHVIDNVRQKIELGYIEYISEIRRLSVLFFGFPGLSVPDETMARRPLESVQQIVQTLQKWMRRLEGSFVQFRCDEKGFLAICAFGLAGSHHTDDASRAISGALQITSAMNKIGIETCVGVTTGDLLCACIGSQYRAEYTLFGNAINLSARLMCKAKTGTGTILCDTITKAKAKRQARYQPLEEVKVKGLEEPVLIYLVTPLNRKAHTRGSRHTEMAHPMFGQEPILDKVMASLRDALAGEEGGAVIIEGEAGSGKTKLVCEIQLQIHRDLTAQAPTVLSSQGDADSSSLPLYPWRSIFENMFLHDKQHGSLDCPNDGGSASPQKDTRLGQALASRMPQYNAVIRIFLAAALEMDLQLMPWGGSSFPDADPGWTDPSASSTNSAQTPFHPFDRPSERQFSSMSQLSDLMSFNGSHSLRSVASSSGISRSSTQKRRSSVNSTAAARRRLILDSFLVVCQQFIEIYGAAIVLLENAHHFDTLSWEFLNLLVHHLDKRFFIVVTLRPSESRLFKQTTNEEKSGGIEKTKAAVESLLKCPRVRRLELKPLDLEAISEFVQALADGAAVSDSVVGYIHERSSGIPLYVEQMTNYLKEQGLLESKAYAGSLAANEGLMHFLRENVTIQQILLEKLDQLKPTTHLTLKALLSQLVQNASKKEVYPFSVPQDVILSNLEELESAGFLIRDLQTDSWNFRSMLDRDALNEIVPSSQRRFLHAKVATALSSGNDPKALSTTVAYHWTQSCLGIEELKTNRVVKAIEWWDKSANEAYERLALVEALRLFQKAADLATSLDDAKPSSKKGSKWSAIHFGHRIGFKRRHRVHEMNNFSVTPLLRARWERRMANLCLGIAAQATTSDQRLDVMNEAALHAFQGLYHLSIPIPFVGDQPLMQAIEIPKHKTPFHRRRKLRPLEAGEASGLLEILVQTSRNFVPYVDAIRSRCHNVFAYVDAIR